MASKHKTIKRTYATYHVGLKILLKKGDNFLFLKNSINKRFDLPGGRIDNVEHTTPLSEVIAREVIEELGEKIQYRLGKPIFQFRRHFEDNGVHIFLTVYDGEFLSGKIKLSSEHSGYQWINPRKINLREEYFQSKEEYIAFKKYFEYLVWFYNDKN